MVYFTPVFSRVPTLLYINVGVIQVHVDAWFLLHKQVGGISSRGVENCFGKVFAWNARKGPLFNPLGVDVIVDRSFVEIGSF